MKVGLLLLACAFVWAQQEIAAEPATPKPGVDKRKRAEQEAQKEEQDEKPADESRAGRPNFYVLDPLLGVWETSGGGGQRLVIEGGGGYKLSGSVADSGVIMARFGQLYRKSPKTGGQWARGSFKLHSLLQLETDGSFGQHTWRRVK